MMLDPNPTEFRDTIAAAICGGDNDWTLAFVEDADAVLATPEMQAIRRALYRAHAAPMRDTLNAERAERMAAHRLDALGLAASVIAWVLTYEVPA